MFQSFSYLKNVSQTQIDSAVKELLSLKSSFKTLTGMEWNAAATIPTLKEEKKEGECGPVGSKGDLLSAQIKECGDHVRDLKTKKAEKVRTKI